MAAGFKLGGDGSSGIVGRGGKSGCRAGSNEPNNSDDDDDFAVPMEMPSDTRDSTRSQGIGRFLARHLWHAPFLIPGAIAVTIAHEFGHALAVWICGGFIVDWAWWPRAGEWGHVSYRFPDGVARHDFWIALAPYLLWTSVAFVADAISRCARPESFGRRSVVFIWLFAIPIADIVYAVVPYLLGASNDMVHVFGAPGWQACALSLWALLTACVWGFQVHCRLYGKDSLGPGRYTLLAIAFYLLVSLH